MLWCVLFLSSMQLVSQQLPSTYSQGSWFARNNTLIYHSLQYTNAINIELEILTKGTLKFKH